MNFLGDLPTKLINPFKDFVLDDGYSRLNRIYLFAICIIAGVIININDYAGETIKCHGFTIFSEPFAENYCWVQGIYVILEAFDIPDENVPYPGIIPEETPCLNYIKSDGTMFMCPDDDAIAPLTRVKLMWYQWIPFYFFLCAAAFYIPYLIYHGTDIGKLKHIGKLLGDMFDDETEETAKLERASLWLSNKMASYIKAKGFFQNLFLRHKFFLIVLTTKIVNLAVVVLVIMLTDQMFVVGPFLSYGIDWALHISRDNTGSDDNPVNKLFPKMAACEVKVWGATGINNEAGLCVLAPNVVNSYFFIIFWFLLVISLAANLFSVLFTTTSYLFTLGTWKALLARTFMDNTPRGKWLYFKSGLSGQITMEILAKNLPAKTFEKLFDMTCTRVIQSADKGILAELQDMGQ